uniref:Hypothetical conserved protein n=1 Tax=uncultured Deinococcota bacterium TaxID=179882 RepID=H5SAB6_9DEIN|nr:hypothetical conserved protein [uncultured Deinococcota bacterium]
MRTFLGALTLALGLGLALFSLRGAFTLLPLEEAPCRPAPLPERAELYANGAVEIPLCRRAWLVLRLQGTPAGGHGPWAMVVEGRRVLWEGEVLGVREVRVRTSGRGVLALAFPNDLYHPPEDRNLFLLGLKVEPGQVERTLAHSGPPPGWGPKPAFHPSHTPR